MYRKLEAAAEAKRCTRRERKGVPSGPPARFNALRNGVLSRYTVLHWEDADEYRAVDGALVAEHGPQGPTEEHLVEELAGILWRKRRLRLAEAAAHRRGLSGTLSSYRETVKMALVHLDAAGQPALSHVGRIGHGESAGERDGDQEQRNISRHRFKRPP